ncbi:MAG: metal ABC transporter ATP-binding protein, partial [Chrysiogenales bacterium]
PDSGSVRIMGSPPGKLPRGTIGYLPQRSSVDFAMPVSVYDVVAMARYAGKGMIERLDAGDRARIDEALEALEISPLRGRHYGSLSGGQKQRVLIARALAVEPKILLLDVPSTGLDAVAQDNFYQLLLRLRDTKKLTIVMVSHDIGAVSSIVDRLACLKTKLHFHGTLTDCFANGSLSKVFGKNIYYVRHENRSDNCGDE